MRDMINLSSVSFTLPFPYSLWVHPVNTIANMTPWHTNAFAQQVTCDHNFPIIWMILLIMVEMAESSCMSSVFVYLGITPECPTFLLYSCFWLIPTIWATLVLLNPIIAVSWLTSTKSTSTLGLPHDVPLVTSAVQPF